MRTKLVTVFSICLMLFLSCGKNSEVDDVNPPSPPEMIVKSMEFAQVETGVDAVPDGDWIFFEWEPNNEEDLEGYEVWRMAEDDSLQVFELFEILSLSQMSNADEPDYFDRTAAAGPDPNTGQSRGFYYYVTAYDGDGNISAPSDTVYYKLLRKPLAASIDSTFANVRWSYPYNLEMDIKFIIRVTRQETGQYIWSAQVGSGQDPYAVPFNFDGTALLMGAGDYYLRIDVTPSIIYDNKHSGAESQLHEFTILAQ